ncbi:MAG: MBL fold metallo-hydrolase [Candidatus Omnitrophica bacterium]|nr:MBL fold metallo-hydrolase [Candidatus Omnitrophota bacterium]
MILEQVTVGAMGVNCYILSSNINSKALIIDPGEEAAKIKKVLSSHKLTPGVIINTHGHYDHIAADDDFNVPVYVHRLDAPLLTEPMLNLSGLFAKPYKVKSDIVLLEDGEIIAFDGIELKVLHTPGHTRGGISLSVVKPEAKVVFTGDTLFYQGIGRSDLAGGDEERLFKSIDDKLFTLPPETKVYPGHGPSSTIGQERKYLAR